MTSRKNRSRFALLGLLATKPMSGYELKKTIGESIGFFWQEGFGQIYPTLRELLKEEWVEMTLVAQDGRPDKKVYTITPKGRASLSHWLHQPPVDYPMRIELLLKIFFGSFDTDGALDEHVENELLKAEGSLKVFTVIRENLRTCADPKAATYSDITLDYGIRLAEMNIAWCKATLTTLGELGKEK